MVKTAGSRMEREGRSSHPSTQGPINHRKESTAHSERLRTPTGFVLNGLFYCGEATGTGIKVQREAG